MAYRNLADLEISLGSHSLVIIEADGSRVIPHRANSVVLSPGQRYSVILEPNPSVTPREGDSFWLRLSMSEECFNIPSRISCYYMLPSVYRYLTDAALDMEQFIRVFYGDSRITQSSGPTLPFALDSGLPEFDLFSLKPLEETWLPPVDQQIKIYVNSMKMDRLGGIPYGYVNQTSWVPDETRPLLLRDTEESLVSGWGKHQLVVTTDRKAASVIELIINNLDEGPHPFHLVRRCRYGACHVLTLPNVSTAITFTHCRRTSPHMAGACITTLPDIIPQRWRPSSEIHSPFHDGDMP